MSDWKPIDCAPVHEAILVYDEEMGICTAKKTQSGLWSYPNSDDFQFTKCNDWMPLPIPPKK